MRRQNILIGTLAIAVVPEAIGALAFALQDRGSAQARADAEPYPGLNGPISPVCPGPTHGTAERGAPGIRPRNECTPSFTAQDVRAALAGVMSLGKIGVVGQPTVTRVVFLTIGDLGRASGDSEWEANSPADMLVCYAELRGTFSYSRPHGPLVTASTTIIVFDARTGNQLVMGTGARLG